MSQTTPARTMSSPVISNAARYATHLEYGRRQKVITSALCPQCDGKITADHIRCPGCGVATVHSIPCRWCGCGNLKTAKRCGEAGGKWLAEMGCGAKNWGPSWWYDKDRLSVTITADDSEFKSAMGPMAKAMQNLQYQMGEAFIPAFERMVEAASRAVSAL